MKEIEEKLLLIGECSFKHYFKCILNQATTNFQLKIKDKGIFEQPLGKGPIHISNLISNITSLFSLAQLGI